MYDLQRLRELVRQSPHDFTAVFRKMYTLVSKLVRSERHRELFLTDFVKMLKQRRFDDELFIRRLAALYNKLSKYSSYELGCKSRKRAKARVNDVVQYMRDISEPVLVDIGSGDGAIVSALAERLCLAKESCFALDIVAPPQGMSPDNVTFKVLPEGKQFTLPFADASVNIVTMFMSAHHIENLGAMLKEVSRILTPKGIFVIREHDIDDDVDAIFMDVVHLLYACVFYNEKSPEDFLSTYFANYRKSAEWRALIAHSGFTVQQVFKPACSKKDLFNSFYIVATKCS